MKKYAVLLVLLLALSGLLCAASALADERAERLLAVAVSELGYTATKGGYTKYGEWGGNAYSEWCSEFVSWCVMTADEWYGTAMLGADYPKQTSCENGAAWFRERGQYVTTAGEIKGAGEQVWLEDGTPVSQRPYVPQRGDLIYIEWYKYNRLDHVGIVEYVTQETDGSYMVHTIEGNNSFLQKKPTSVARYAYKLDDASIRGYGTLNPTICTLVESGSSGESVVCFQKMLKQLGYYDGDCAGKFGKATVTATQKYQKAKGLAQTGKGDWETWRTLTEEIRAAQEAAAEKAKAVAEKKAAAQLEKTKEALASGWFGEFDPYDEAAAWSRLMADITVLDVPENEKVYLSDGPNGKRKVYDNNRGFFFGSTVAVHVLDIQDDWAQIEAYNVCDELEVGWVRAKRLKTVTPNSTWGIIVDKQRQRLYLYKEGKLLTELLVSTGTTAGANSDYNETASGDFLLGSSVGGFYSGNLWCNYAIRFNGGDLLHLVPSIFAADGVTENFAVCEQALGSKASHGCIRVQRLPNKDGYNHLWIWNNLRKEKKIKIIVWDDDGRLLPELDASGAVYYNPDGGKKYHLNKYCPSVKDRYLPMTGITYGDLTRYPYSALTPCGTCSAPDRPETVWAANAMIRKAYEELGLPVP